MLRPDFFNNFFNRNRSTPMRIHAHIIDIRQVAIEERCFLVGMPIEAHCPVSQAFVDVFLGNAGITGQCRIV